MTEAYRVTRTVTKDECRWLGDEIFEEGQEVYRYTGPTYGCVGDGIAVTVLPGETPFFELPYDALEVIES